MPDVLPDCRPRHKVGSIFVAELGCWMVRTYCGNCGKEGPFVNEDATFAFCQCDPCAEKYGHPAHLMVEPEQVFLERIENERRLQTGVNFDDPVSLLKAVEDPSNPLSALARDWSKHVRSFA